MRTAVCLLALMSTSVWAAQQRPAPRPQPPPPQRGRASTPAPAYMQELKFYEEAPQATKAVLKNGLTVLVQEWHAQPVAALALYVKSGWANDPEARPGASAAVARMILRGGAGSNRAGADIAKEVRALGGRFDARAEIDHTWFVLTAPAAQWKKGLETEAHALLEPAFDDGAWAREALAAAGDGAPELDRLVALAHGLPDRGPALTAAALGEHYRASYGPGRAFLVACGDVNTSEILREAVRLYGKWKGADRAPGATRPAEGFRYREVRGDFPTPRVRVGFPIAPVSSADFPALEIAGALLGAGDGAALERRLRDQKKLILSASSEVASFTGGGLLALDVEVEPQDLDRAEIALFTEIELLKREPPDDVDLSRAVAQLERIYWGSIATVGQRARVLARLEAFGNWKAWGDLLARLRKVTAEDVARVARKYLRVDNALVVEHLPAAAEARGVSGDVIARTIRELLPAATDQEATAREALTVAAVKIPEARPPFKGTEVRHPMQKASVLRGPELFIKEDHTAPIVQMGIFFPGGKLLETRESAGIAALTLRAMLRAAGKAPAREQFVQQLGVYGGELEPVVEDDYFGFRLTVLSGSVESALDLVFGMFKGAKFEPEAVEREKVLLKADARRECGAPELLLDEAAFGDHPYARCRYGSEATVASLTPDAVAAWYKSNVEYHRPVVVIMGDTEGTSLARYFVRSFSGSRYEDVKVPQGAPKGAGKRTVREAPSGTRHSSVLLGFEAPPQEDEDSYALIVLAELASGAGGWLEDALGERDRVAFAASLTYTPRLRGGALTARVDCAASAEEKALAGLEAELKRLVDGPILYKDYRAAINLAVGRYWIDHQTRDAQIERMARFFLAGKNVDEINNHPASLQAVREEDLPAAARRFLNPARAAVLRLHGKPE
jgi:zinc protease